MNWTLCAAELSEKLGLGSSLKRRNVEVNLNGMFFNHHLNKIVHDVVEKSTQNLFADGLRHRWSTHRRRMDCLWTSYL